ncbi:uncharacterized protein LOC116346070 [Contarinia nasturtii]|uniref:uncharacterized protein LOC116346070 n=1 Tax=Contarinia nasturtii TaxID=265458 RepID=UPI0012D3D680|nr:uncharacterized protein LOC116346070 [Contarinia nasturtii]
MFNCKIFNLLLIGFAIYQFVEGGCARGDREDNLPSIRHSMSSVSTAESAIHGVGSSVAGRIVEWSEDDDSAPAEPAPLSPNLGGGVQEKINLFETKSKAQKLPQKQNSKKRSK